MTRKDLDWLADQLRVLRNQPVCAVDCGLVNQWLFDLIDDLARQHPRFDRLRFLKVCGMI